MTDAPAPQTRYHAFDALRAGMMLLGVLLHACQFYLTVPLSEGLDYRDTHTSGVCDVAFFGIHTFRMQVFFVMAGFFAALLRDRRGTRGMWSNRMRRVGLPLVVGWLILFPPSVSAFIYGCAKNAGYPAWAAVRTWWRTGDFPWVEGGEPIYSLFLISPFHLWFLYALLWFYLGAVVVLWIGRRRGGAIARGTHRLFRGLAHAYLLLPASIILTTLTLLPHPAGIFSQEFPAFIPNPLALIAFGPFFGFGWMLYRNIDLLPRLARRPLLALAAAGVVLVGYFGLIGSTPAVAGESPPRVLIALASSAIAWLCVCGFIGLFLRFLDRPSRTMRYVSDSAYWVYLAHLPLVYGMHGLLFDLPLPALVKVGIILAVATPLLFASYDLLVRPSFVGRFLNGRTHPSALLGSRGGHTVPEVAINAATTSAAGVGNEVVSR